MGGAWAATGYEAKRRDSVASSRRERGLDSRRAIAGLREDMGVYDLDRKNVITITEMSHSLIAWQLRET